jgi:tRNA-specific 2-thiouridylase
VVVGSQAALAISKMTGSKYSWCGVAPENIADWTEIHVQVRAHSDAVAGAYRVLDGQMEIVVNEPIIGVAPGQTAVLYLGTRVLGQTTIEKTVSVVSVGVE